MSEPQVSESLPASDLIRERVDHACEPFSAAWKAGGRPQIKVYLGKAAGLEREKLLQELLRLDLEHRAKIGAHPVPGDYQEEFAEEMDLIRAVFRETACRAPAPETQIDPERTVSNLPHAEADEPDADTAAAKLPEIPGYEIQGILGRTAMS